MERDRLSEIDGERERSMERDRLSEIDGER